MQTKYTIFFLNFIFAAPMVWLMRLLKIWLIPHLLLHRPSQPMFTTGKSVKKVYRDCHADKIPFFLNFIFAAPIDWLMRLLKIWIIPHLLLCQPSQPLFTTGKSVKKCTERLSCRQNTIFFEFYFCSTYGLTDETTQDLDHTTSAPVPTQSTYVHSR